MRNASSTCKRGRGGAGLVLTSDTHFGVIAAELQRAGSGTGAIDTMIAAHALAVDAVIVPTTPGISNACPDSRLKTGPKDIEI